MHIQLASDLHLEFFKQSALTTGQLAVNAMADVIVLAGDIHRGMASLNYCRDMAQAHGKPVLITPGNHEYYAEDWELLNKQFLDWQHDGVHVLLNRQVVIQNVRFCGATLWTDFELYKHAKRVNTPEKAMAVGGMHLNDFRVIRNGTRAFSPEDSLRAHQASRKFLEEVLTTPFEGKTVVVSHHAPHPKSIHPRFAPGDRVLSSAKRLPSENPNWALNVCFCSDLTPLVEKADVWLHGHCHDSSKYTVGKCQVYANPRGYPLRCSAPGLYFENGGFEPHLLIKV